MLPQRRGKREAKSFADRFWRGTAALRRAPGFARRAPPHRGISISALAISARRRRLPPLDLPMLAAKFPARERISLASRARLRDGLALRARRFRRRRVRGGRGSRRTCDGVRGDGRAKRRKRQSKKHDNENAWPLHLLRLQFAIATPTTMTSPPSADIGVRRSPRKTAAKTTPTIGVK